MVTGIQKKKVCAILCNGKLDQQLWSVVGSTGTHELVKKNELPGNETVAYNKIENIE